MPMLNLRHQIKCGRMERRTGAVTSDVDGSFLPKIVTPAPIHQGYGLANERSRDQSVPDPAFTKLPYLPTAPVAAKPSRARPACRRVQKPADDLPRSLTGVKSKSAKALSIQEATKPSRIPVLVRDGSAWLKKVTKPSRIPVLVRDGNAVVNNPPKRDLTGTKPKAMAIIKPTRRANELGHGVASDDTNLKLPDIRSRNQTTTRRGPYNSDVSGIVSPSCDAGSANPWDMDNMAETRRQRIQKYTKIFDELVKATAEAIALERHDTLDRIAKEKEDAIGNAVRAVVEETFA